MTNFPDIRVRWFLIGHPNGCTGTRQMINGTNQLKRNGYSTGLITLCIGCGMGVAMVIER